MFNLSSSEGKFLCVRNQVAVVPVFQKDTRAYLTTFVCVCVCVCVCVLSTVAHYL